jgi:hypothetical protein
MGAGADEPAPREIALVRARLKVFPFLRPGRWARGPHPRDRLGIAGPPLDDPSEAG